MGGDGNDDVIDFAVFSEAFLFELFDGKRIEIVLMREKERVTVCISTQVGCALNCIFCATGKSGFERNLSAGEIVDQLIAVKGYLKEDEKIFGPIVLGYPDVYPDPPDKRGPTVKFI